jgi:hypothetical protein
MYLSKNMKKEVHQRQRTKQVQMHQLKSNKETKLTKSGAYKDIGTHQSKTR